MSVRKFPVFSPEISELDPEISELAAANGQISGRGINTPPPTSSTLALQDPNHPIAAGAHFPWISLSSQPNPMIVGDPKEKTPIYIATEGISLSPSLS